MTSVDPVMPVMGDAQRIRLVIGRFIGSGYVFYFLVALPRMSEQAGIVAGWWTPIAVILAFMPGWLLLATSFLPPRRWTSTLLPLACGLGYLVALVLWFVAWNGQPLSGATWMISFPGLASLALVLGPRQWLAGPHLVIVTGLALATNWVTDDHPNDMWVSASGLAWSVAFSGAFVAAGAMAVRTGVVLDTTRERTHRIAAEAAAEEARDAERSRYDGLVHDGVLAVMLAIRPDPVDSRLASQAQRVMDELDAAPDDPYRPAGLPELIAAIRTSIASVDDAIAVDADPAATHALDLTHATVQALAGAAAEAARNSTRHAGVEANVGVAVDVTSERIRVTVSDDGVGFDPLSVRRDRLGMSVSIRARMAAAGGRALVTSAVGSGTRVCLEWPS